MLSFMAFLRGKIAFVTGITGQAGSYLAELLLSEGYQVHGLCRPTSDLTASRWRLADCIDHPSLHLHYGDLLDGAGLSRLLRDIQPSEIFNLAASSHVKVSFDTPELAANINGLGVLRLLEAMRLECPNARFMQASTSELFGDSPPPQNEKTPMRPRSPYAAAKLYAYWLVRNYREAYGLHASNGIFFNMESPRRSPAFVTRKITREMARIAWGKSKAITLGNLDSRRDWMHAKDGARGMLSIVQSSVPDDFVLASGKCHSICDFIQLAWLAAKTGRPEIISDPAYMRPTEVSRLRGDPSKAAKILGWSPEYSLEQIVEEMVKADLERERATP